MDEVVVQNHRDKVLQYHEVGYDVLFVGDDWKGEALFTDLENYLKQYEAKVEYFEYTKEVSSTKFTEILQGIYDAENYNK